MGGRGLGDSRLTRCETLRGTGPTILKDPGAINMDLEHEM